jgi:Domain of unknown function (DUF4440)
VSERRRTRPGAHRPAPRKRSAPHVPCPRGGAIGRARTAPNGLRRRAFVGGAGRARERRRRDPCGEERLRRGDLGPAPDTHAVVDELLAEDVLFVQPHGTSVGKGAVLQGHRPPRKRTFSRVEYREVEIRDLGSTAAVSCRTEHGIRDRTFSLRTLHVWRRIERPWKVVAVDLREVPKDERRTAPPATAERNGGARAGRTDPPDRGPPGATARRRRVGGCLPGVPAVAEGPRRPPGGVPRGNGRPSTRLYFILK